MDSPNARALTSQLADDLAWLEQHCRTRPEQARAAGQLRMAASLVRNVIGPYLEGQSPTPLHVAVVGGAGAGKSTVANLLSGATLAEANPQAGFTRHPIAYTSTNGPLNWAGYLGFLGPLTRLSTPSPSSVDEDVYQVRRVPADPSAFDLLKDFVVWDCPDMTTWAAEGYVPRLMEVAGLADVVVYVASDERYNDEVPTEFLRLLLQTGKPVVVCLMKMREQDAPALVEHFRKEVLGSMPGGAGQGAVGTLAIPFLSPAQLADPARQAARWRIPLLNQVAVLGNPAATARRRTVEGAARYLARHQEDLLSVARHDVQALGAWQALVQSGERDFEQRYVREYLTSEKFRGFDEALVRLMELLEVPGVGMVVSVPLYILRTPYRLAAGLWKKAFTRPEGAGRPEQPILEEALTGWLDLLRKESVRRSGEHPLWAHVAQGFQGGGLAEKAREQFKVDYRCFQASLSAEVTRTAQAIYQELETKPVVLNTLRGSKLALDVAAIGGTLAAGGIGWYDLLFVPVATSATHAIVEGLGKGVVESERERTRRRQHELLRSNLAGPLAAWLTNWPATGGSSFQRLQDALRRVPGAVAEVGERVRGAGR